MKSQREGAGRRKYVGSPLEWTADRPHQARCRVYGLLPHPRGIHVATAQHKACPGVGNNALPSYSFSTQLTCPEKDTVEAQRTHPTVRQ